MMVRERRLLHDLSGKVPDSGAAMTSIHRLLLAAAATWR